MPSTPQKTIFVVGTGPLIGSHTARHFAANGFTHVALFARSPATLSASASFVAASAPSASIHTYPADVTDSAALTAALETAVREAGAPEVVIYNAARINYGAFGEYGAEDIVTDFKIPNLGLYTTARVVVPFLQRLARSKDADDANAGDDGDDGGHPCLFVTSSALIHEPLAPVFSLSMAKAAQASLVKLLAGMNEGVVHVALLSVGGQVGMEEEVRNPANIAGRFWELYRQGRGRWEFEMRCGW